MAGNPGGGTPTGGPFAPERHRPSAADLRVSDAERDKAISQLGERFAEGRLTHDTFVHRVEAALRARHRGDLAELLADLPSPRRLGSTLLAYGQRRWAAGTGWAAGTRGMPRGRPAASPPMLMFPSGDRHRFTIGRDAACDMVLPDPTVSRWHAGLKREPGGWVLDDLGSTNGTTLNGWRVRETVPVRAGDRVSFGALTFVIGTPGSVPATVGGG